MKYGMRIPKVAEIKREFKSQLPYMLAGFGLFVVMAWVFGWLG